MARALALLALSLLLLGLEAPAVQADRLGPFCFTVVPTATFFFPELLLEVFVDSEPYGQVFLGTARTLKGADTPSFVTAQVGGRFILISVVGSSFLKPSFVLGGQIDSQASPPSGEVSITITDPGSGTIVNGQVVPVGTLPGTMTLVPCP